MYCKYVEKSGFDAILNGEKKKMELLHSSTWNAASNVQLKSVKLTLMMGKRKDLQLQIKTDCKFFVCLKHINDSKEYEIFKYEEVHNHRLFTRQSMQL